MTTKEAPPRHSLAYSNIGAVSLAWWSIGLGKSSSADTDVAPCASPPQHHLP
jgi:hypothetical protein